MLLSKALPLLTKDQENLEGRHKDCLLLFDRQQLQQSQHRCVTHLYVWRFIQPHKYAAILHPNN